MKRAAQFTSPKDIVVVIPTLNEADHLKSCLETVKGRSEVSEIIVADGGSKDDTCRIAAEFGAQVVHVARGRGLQIAAGIKASNADVCLIIHADCHLSRGVPARIIQRLTDRPESPGGALGMQFESDKGKMRLLSALNNWRAILTGMSFGDQGQFVRREALAVIGGYPAIPIMEDVELSLRMRQAGPLLYLKKGITVSDRRWSRTGFDATVTLVLGLFFKYLIERRCCKDKIDYEKYYQSYYK